MMAVKCPRARCSAHIQLQTYDGPALCTNGHPISVTDVSTHVLEFFDRVGGGASA